MKCEVASQCAQVQDWQTFSQALYAFLQELEVTAQDGRKMNAAAGFALWERRCLLAKSEGRGIYFVGNGASASMASHFACDVGKNAGFRTRTFSDVALLTAMGNDLAFDQIFSAPLRNNAQAGDILVAVSSSGNSPNIVAAADVAREMGLWIITLTGMKPGNRLRSSGDLNFWVQADTYGMVETAHAAILHHWTDRLVAMREQA